MFLKSVFKYICAVSLRALKCSLYIKFGLHQTTFNLYAGSLKMGSPNHFSFAKRRIISYFKICLNFVATAVASSKFLLGYFTRLTNCLARVLTFFIVHFRRSSCPSYLAVFNVLIGFFRSRGDTSNSVPLKSYTKVFFCALSNCIAPVLTPFFKWNSSWITRPKVIPLLYVGDSLFDAGEMVLRRTWYTCL